MMLEGGTSPEARIAYGFRVTVARSPRSNELDVLTAGFRRMLADFRQRAFRGRRTSSNRRIPL